MKNSLSILESILANRSSKATRLTELLKNPEEDYSQDWYMCVPKCFNDALDIKKTTRILHKQEELVWTQGATFSFKVGDILYDTVLAYQLPWHQAIHHIRLAIQITTIKSAITTDYIDVESAGGVVFQLLTTDDSKMRLEKIDEYTLSQLDFVRFLIKGPEGKLKSIISLKIDKMVDYV